MERTDTPVMKDPVLHMMGLRKTLGFYVVSQSTRCVKMDLPVRPELYQPAHFLHGGATLTLLESCASWASQLGIDNERFFSFGSHVDIRHLNSIREGTLHGIATFNTQEDLGDRGIREYWNVEATDDNGQIISKGMVTTRVVSKEYFADREDRKQEQRADQGAAQPADRGDERTADPGAEDVGDVR